MRFSMLSIALLAAPIFAFTIPDGQPDGTYGVSYDADGKEIHTLIAAATSNAGDLTANPTEKIKRTLHSAKFKRNTYQCGGDALAQGDTDTANANIDAQCGNGNIIQAYMNFYSISGCTVAYACNFAGNAQQCYASARQAASQGITDTCGAYRSGWLVSEGGSISYGYEDHCRVGNNFCPN